MDSIEKAFKLRIPTLGICWLKSPFRKTGSRILPTQTSITEAKIQQLREILPINPYVVYSIRISRTKSVSHMKCTATIMIQNTDQEQMQHSLVSQKAQSHGASYLLFWQEVDVAVVKRCMNIGERQPKWASSWLSNLEKDSCPAILLPRRSIEKFCTVRTREKGWKFHGQIHAKTNHK